MNNRRPAVLTLVVCLLAAALRASDPAAIDAALKRAEEMRSRDKAGSRRLLDQAQRMIGATPDPLLVARAQLLECTWADDPPTAYRAVATGLAAAERAGSLALRAKLIACRGNALWFDSKAAEAERDFLTAAELARLARDPRTEADALANAGSLRYTRGAMADALTNLQAAYRIDVNLGREKERLDALTMIANVYADSQVAQYDRAIEYYRQLLGAYEKHGQPADVADTLFNMGGTYETKGDFRSSEAYYRRALELFAELDRPADVAFTKRALASAIMKQERVREALPLLDEVVAYYTRERSEQNLASARQFRGMAYRRLGRPAEALRELEAARRHFEQEKNVRFLEKNAAETSLAYGQLGDWRNAFDAGQRHAELQQQLAAARRDEDSSRLRVEFDVEKKEQENRALIRENALRTEALRNARRTEALQRIAIVLAALLVVTMALLFWRQVVHTRRMRAMALTDELTRLPNRRHILAAADMIFAEAKRKSGSASVIVFDIDRFKRINDTLGHAAGDAVLQSVARTCRLTLRPSDQLGRTGGEEFLVVLQDATSTEAAAVAERLRAAVEAIDFSSVDPTLRVTISLGVAQAEAYEPQRTIASADALLYRAKEGGRNRVEFAVA